MVIDRVERAQKRVGQRVAQHVLGRVAHGLKTVVLLPGAAQLGGRVARRVLRPGRGGRLLLDDKAGQREGRARKPLVGQAQVALGRLLVKRPALADDIEIEQRGVAVAALDELVHNVAADDAELALGHQKGCKAHGNLQS